MRNTVHTNCELLDGPSVKIAVSCSQENHFISLDENGAPSLDNHGLSDSILISLGAKESTCHKIENGIYDLAEKFKIEVHEAFLWVGMNMTQSGVSSWMGSLPNPHEVKKFLDIGVRLAKDYRKLRSLGVSTAEQAAQWCRVACTSSRVPFDVNLVAVYINAGVDDPREAADWRSAGLKNPAQLGALLKRGMTPQRYRRKHQEILELKTAPT